MRKGIASTILALAASMLSARGSVQQYSSLEKPVSRKPKLKRAKKYGWRNARTLEYFGERSSVVLAFTENGQKKMKLKNALKGGFSFIHNGSLQNIGNTPSGMKLTN